MKCSLMAVAIGCVLWLGSAQRALPVTEATAQPVTAGNDPRLVTFATQKWRQVEAFSAKTGVPIPEDTRVFFKFALAGDWAGVSNQFAKIIPRVFPGETSVRDPAFTNALWVPMHEMVGAYECFQWFTPAQLKQYADGILGSMSSNSIYFGGTSPGRFVITTVRDTANAPDIVIITQNGLDDARYVDYLRLNYGERPGLWLPTETDLQAAFRDYIRDVQERQSRGQKFGPDEGVSTNKDGHVTVRSAGGIFAVRGSMAKMIFDHNKANHDFYAEESFVIPWMYPYLEPHGLITKLNKEPFAQLDPAIVARDRQFWDELSKRLLADPEFLGNESERRTYSKLRSGIAGLYAVGTWGRTTNETAMVIQHEAEAVFQQSIALWPTNPESNFRLAQLYIELHRYDDAVAVLEKLETLTPPGPDKPKIRSAITQLHDMKQQMEVKQGRSTLPDGSTYQGELKYGQPDGHGTLTWTNGWKYVGEFKDGGRSGQGTLTHPDGSNYVGGFKSGNYDGQGTLTFSDGRTYVGEFRNGRMDGPGWMTYPDGKIQDGWWNQDRFIGSNP